MIRLEAADQPTLALYHQPAQADLADVIYVHGSTFGAELSVLWHLASLALFAPIRARDAAGGPPQAAPVAAPALSHLLLSAWAQYRRFVEDVPPGVAQPLSEAHFHEWSEAFIATDANAGQRLPPAVLSPAGPQCDVRALRNGQALYDATAIKAPTLLVRGEWDRACNAADMDRLQASLAHAIQVTIPGATHLLHLEASRGLLYNAVNTFLSEASNDRRDF